MSLFAESRLAEPAWVSEVLRFWFEELSAADWFGKSDAVDERIRARFGALWRTLRDEPPATALGSARRALATVIVLDQFPRNMFRASPEAFASDSLALAISRAAVDAGLDRQLVGARSADGSRPLDVQARLFLYLPFEHSEAIEDQHRSVALIGALGDAKLTHYAEAHRVIIARFGRFPHRNAALGRQSTAEELAFLAGPDSSF